MGPIAKRTTQRVYSCIKAHRRISLVTVFFLAWAVATLIFYHRFPQNYLYPNFFAEDGQHFTKNIMDKGFLGGLLTPFNGYFIFGIYILTEIGFFINSLLYHGQFADLPASLALVSYAFLGLCAALPVLLLRSYVRLPYRLAMVLPLALLPMPSFDYGTIGTIGNLKFPFVYICFLLVLYRIRLPNNAKRIFIIDSVLLIGMFTTAGCYIALPFILLSKQILPKKWRSKVAWKSLLRRDNFALWSLLGLGILATTQIAYVAIHGTPSLTGYLDQPYQWSKTIEVFIARPYLYPYVASVYHHLRGVYVLGISLVGLFVIFRYGSKQNRYLYIFGLTAIFFTTAVFIYNRTGVSFYYNHYQTTGFDNFYYTQNFIALTLGFILLADLARRWRQIAHIGASFAALLLIVNMVHANGSYPPNDFMQYQILPLKTQLASLCATPSKQVTFSVYPFSFLTMTEPHATVCTATVSQSKPAIENYGLQLDTDDLLPITPGAPRFYQTFSASAPDLKAIAIYSSTYYQTRINHYALTLLDATCSHAIAHADLPTRLRDNSYVTVPIHSSLKVGSQYCFTIAPTATTAPPFALHFASTESSMPLSLRVGNAVSSKESAFEIVY